MIEIVMVHDVVGGDDVPPGPYACAITAGCLEAYLDRRADWASWGGRDLELWYRSGCFTPERPIFVLTFDDAYKSIRTRVADILERHRAKALVFVTTRCADGWEPAEPRLWRFLQSVSELKETPWGHMRVATAEQKVQVYERIRTTLKGMTPGQWEPLLSSLSVPDTSATHGYMTWNDLAELKGHPWIECGSHTLEHVHLPSVGIRELQRQVFRSRQILEKRLGTPVCWLAYPYGGVDVRTLLVARAARYSGAFLAGPGSGRPLPRVLSRYMIPRIDIRHVERSQT